MNVMAMWNKFSALPKGREIFSFMIGKYAPYTGTIGAVVQELSPGRAVVKLRDRRKVRNHLQSVHAIALMNLAEMSSGLSMLAGLPEGMRGILTHLEIDFVKKARGTLTSLCETKVPKTETAQILEIPVEVKDESGEVVARAKAIGKIGPNKK
jgi:acyl-coenzyme A thioesterase PaaI-like protein